MSDKDKYKSIVFSRFFEFTRSDGSVGKFSDDTKWYFISGKFTSEAVDTYGTIITRAAVMDALASYMEFGNVRVMHNREPVGIISTIGVPEYNDITVKIPANKRELITDIENGLYKGFSMGFNPDFNAITVLKGSEIDQSHLQIKFDEIIVFNKINIVEISIVDRPANLNAKFDVRSLIPKFRQMEDVMKDKNLNSTEAVTDTEEERVEDVNASEGIEETNDIEHEDAGAVEFYRAALESVALALERLEKVVSKNVSLLEQRLEIVESHVEDLPPVEAADSMDNNERSDDADADVADTAGEMRADDVFVELYNAFKDRIGG